MVGLPPQERTSTSESGRSLLQDWWQHKIRLEQILPFGPAKQYLMCISSKRRGPIEHCGSPWVFMELQDEHPQWKVLPEFVQLLLDHQDEFRHLAYWVDHEHFDRPAANHCLAEWSDGHTGETGEKGNPYA